MTFEFKCKNCGFVNTARELQSIQHGQDIRPIDSAGEDVDYGNEEVFWDSIKVVGFDCKHCLREVKSIGDLFEVVSDGARHRPASTLAGE